MANDSSTGGYLSPAATPAPFEGAALSAFLHDFIAGVSGLAPTTVIPRWQPEPPNLLNWPGADASGNPVPQPDWCAFGITARVADVNAFVHHYDGTPPYDELHRHEVVELLCSFYGANAEANAAIFREGVQIDQNREQLQLNSMGLVETGDTITVPSLVKERWLYRVDIQCKIRRQIIRRYPILNLASATGTLNNEQYVTPIVVTGP